MKNAGSVRSVREGNLHWILKLCALLCLLQISKSFTPPRIIYGGWTPILPGHPFYFGPVRRRNVEYPSNGITYMNHKSPLDEPFSQHSVHNVEQHYEEHLEFVGPGPYNKYPHNQPEIYSHTSGHDNHPPVNTQPTSGYSPGKEIYSQYPPESVFKGTPFNGQKTSGYDLGKPVYPQISPPLQYNSPSTKGHAISNHDLGKVVYSQQSNYDGPPNGQQITPVHKTNKDVYSYYTPEPDYGGPPHQTLNDGPSVSEVHVPGKESYVQIPPQSSYDGPEAPQSDKAYPSSDLKPNKDIYSYYPPQSVYDKPKEPEIDYKPVYNENPKKPLDIYENPRHQVPFVLPNLKDIPIQTLNLHDLNTLRNAGKNTYLKLTPIGEVNSDVIKQLRNIHLDQIKYLGANFQKNGKYPVIKNHPGPTPKHPQYNPYTATYFKGNIPSSNLNYGINGRPGTVNVPYNTHQSTNYKFSNDYKGTAFPLESNQPTRRPLNPIETKKYRNSQSQAIKSGKLVPKLNNYKDVTMLSDMPVSPIYPPSSDVFSDIKYRTPTKTLNNNLAITKNVFPQSIINKNLPKHINKYLGSSYPTYSPIKPFYTKTSLQGSVVPYSSLPKYPTLVHLPLRTMPQPVVPKTLNYLNKNLKLQTLYKNPSIVANIRGSPALIEREVAIINVPVHLSKQNYRNANEYPSDKEYLFYTASTPESIQIPDTGKFNKNVSHVIVNKYAPLFSSNDSYTSIEYAGDKKSHTTSYVDASPEEPSREIDDNRVHSSSYQNEYPYIFVSSNGVHGDHNRDPSSQQGLKKQFFHAYYAPGDHVAPPGYVKMTVQEFNNLFKNAEIRYVDKDPAAISPVNSIHSSQSAS